MAIVIELRGEVVPKAATQFVVRGKIAMGFTPEHQRRYHEALRYAASKTMGEAEPLDGPLHMDLTVTRQPLKSFSNVMEAKALAGLVWPDTRPDLSNYIKMVEDALSKIVFNDDNQICSIMARKKFGLIPGVRIEISLA